MCFSKFEIRNKQNKSNSNISCSGWLLTGQYKNLSGVDNM